MVSEQVNHDYVFNFKREIRDNYISDLKLFIARCQKFQDEFRKHGEFDPMEKCVTIASACHRYWRKKLLPKIITAIEPSSGWHGARTNQSVRAFQGLAW